MSIDGYVVLGWWCVYVFVGALFLSGLFSLYNFIKKKLH